jgi:hypothetical protein
MPAVEIVVGSVALLGLSAWVLVVAVFCGGPRHG